MRAIRRNNVQIIGRGEEPMMFAHGYGCDQNMWRLLTPAFVERYRIILYDLVGCGKSDLSAYDYEKYGSLKGHAQDILEILAEVSERPCVFVGHSVSAMTGLLAAIEEPRRFSSLVMTPIPLRCRRARPATGR